MPELTTDERLDRLEQATAELGMHTKAMIGFGMDAPHLKRIIEAVSEREAAESAVSQ